MRWDLVAYFTVLFAAIVVTTMGVTVIRKVERIEDRTETFERRIVTIQGDKRSVLVLRSGELAILMRSPQARLTRRPLLPADRFGPRPGKPPTVRKNGGKVGRMVPHARNVPHLPIPSRVPPEAGAADKVPHRPPPAAKLPDGVDRKPAAKPDRVGRVPARHRRPPAASDQTRKKRTEPQPPHRTETPDSGRICCTEGPAGRPEENSLPPASSESPPKQPGPEEAPGCSEGCPPKDKDKPEHGA